MSQTGEIIWELVFLIAPYLICPLVIAIALVMRRRYRAALGFGLLGYAIPAAAMFGATFLPASWFAPNGLGFLFIVAPLALIVFPLVFAAVVLLATRRTSA